MEFSCNNFVNISVGKSPSHIVYGRSPINSFELRQLDKGDISSVKEDDFFVHLKSIHEEVRKHITKMNRQYKEKVDVKRWCKEFKIGDEVMVYLRKEIFLVGTYNKMKMKKFGLCKIVKKHDSENAYEVELPIELNIAPIFNILDLTEYYEGGDRD